MLNITVKCEIILCEIGLRIIKVVKVWSIFLDDQVAIKYNKINKLCKVSLRNINQ